MVTDYEAMAAGAKRFIGRVFDASAGQGGGWAPVETPVTVPDRAEYRQAVREGDLLAADQETAKLCQVPWADAKTTLTNKSRS